jgi:hypothetical protein
VKLNAVLFGQGEVKLVQTELGGLLEQLDKRRATVEAHVGHTLLRLEADALTSALRGAERVHRERKRNVENSLTTLLFLDDRERLLLLEKSLNLAPPNSSQRSPGIGAAEITSGQQQNEHDRTEAKKLKAAYFATATHQLKRTSEVMRDWSFDVSKTAAWVRQGEECG